MIQVGTVEARTHFNRLLQRVATGERILITNRGKPVAVLAPPEPEESQDTAMVGREMLAYRDRVQRKLGGRSFREMAHEGHRY